MNISHVEAKLSRHSWSQAHVEKGVEIPCYNWNGCIPEHEALSQEVKAIIPS